MLKRISSEDFYVTQDETQFLFFFDGLRIGSFRLKLVQWKGQFELWSVEIKPEFRGHGFGKKMMKQAVTLARRLGRKLGIKTLWLNCYRQNSAACRCYKAVGFKLKHVGFSMMEGTLALR